MARLAAVLAAATIGWSLAARADVSDGGRFVNLEFRGRVLADPASSNQAAVASQIRYTIGQLNGFGGGSHPPEVALSQVSGRRVDGKLEVTYRAVLPALLPMGGALPPRLELFLPIDLTRSGERSFATAYGQTCVDFGAHDVDEASMFYYFRPRRAGCKLAASDALAVSATVSRSTPQITAAAFPEYDRIWADGVFRSVVIFAKYESGATTSADSGINAYNAFVSAMKAEWAPLSFSTVPASVPSSPGVGIPDIQFRTRPQNGRHSELVVLLVDDLRAALDSHAFRRRYEELSPRADLIVYNGHSGLGANVRAIGSAGRWLRDHYAVVFLNGPGTWSYLDRQFLSARRALDAGDRGGVRHLDVIVNAMPAFFHNMAPATMALVRGLASIDNPKTYQQLLAAVGGNQLALVVGEQNNVYRPAVSTPWLGLNETGTVTRNESRRWSTPPLSPGRYTFTLTGTGDADLYVRRGSPPTTSTFDCRPQKSGGDETCVVQFSAPSTIHLMILGHANFSTFQLLGRKD